ncbi:MAG: adenylosuccinate lyase, partial [Candidatus Omnitrophota bacterium]
QRVLIELMNKGLTRTKAYDVVQRCAMKTWRQGSDFKANISQDKVASRHLGGKDLDKIFDLDYYLRNTNKIFSRVFR